jgi:hypothetical protein
MTELKGEIKKNKNRLEKNTIVWKPKSKVAFPGDCGPHTV